MAQSHQSAEVVHGAYPTYLSGGPSKAIQRSQAPVPKSIGRVNLQQPVAPHVQPKVCKVRCSTCLYL